MFARSVHLPDPYMCYVLLIYLKFSCRSDSEFLKTYQGIGSIVYIGIFIVYL